jgi:hypothetical protein
MKTPNRNRKFVRVTNDILYFKEDLSRVRHPSIKRWIQSAIAEKEKGLRLITKKAPTQPGHARRKRLDI